MSMTSHEKHRPPRGLAQRALLPVLVAACCASLAVPPLAAQDAGAKAGAKAGAAPAAKVDSAFVTANKASTQEWPTVGLDYGETRYSKLKQINTDNVKDLSIAWSYDLEALRGVEATPLVVDGVMYTSSACCAGSGARTWTCTT